MTKYLIKGKLKNIVGKILSAHVELQVEEEGSAAIEALLQHKDFPAHLFTEGTFVIDNFSIEDCDPFEKIEYEEVKESITFDSKEIAQILEGLNMCEMTYINPTAVENIKKIKEKIAKFQTLLLYTYYL